LKLKIKIKEINKLIKEESKNGGKHVKAY